MSVRVRYAPSPTGLQHVGGLRTALFNYLFARSSGGVFYLRLEDTDRTRYNADAEKDLYESLSWAGLSWDEGPDKGGPYGPYVQSQRLDIYHQAIETLLEKSMAYRCFCSTERLDTLRKNQESKGQTLGYDGVCRQLSTAEIQRLNDEGRPSVVRFSMPSEGNVVVEDQLLGSMSFACAELPADPVLLKSDGFPTYHLAHVVDDHSMHTSHVIRSQEWVASLGLHALLFQAFEWDAPSYIHLPLVMGTDGQKLSKRHGATAVRQFQEAGYLPEALVNGLTLLGWSLDDSTEFFTLKDLEKQFSLERLNKSAAVLDYKKLEYFNGLHIRSLSNADLEKRLVGTVLSARPDLDPTKVSRSLALLLPHLRDRVVFLSDVLGMTDFLWSPPECLALSDLIPKKQGAEAVQRFLEAATALLEGLESRTEEEVEAAFRDWAAANGAKLGDILMPLRVAVTGSRVSLPLLPSLKVLGLEESLKRIRKVQKFLLSQQGENG